MRYRYRVLYYTYPPDPELLSRLKGKLRDYTLLLNPDKTCLHDALLITAMTSGEVIIARSGDTFLIAPSQDVPSGWTSGEEFLIGRERGLEKVAGDIVGKGKGNVIEGALVVGFLIILSYVGYRLHSLGLINNFLFLLGLFLSLFGGRLRGYRRRRSEHRLLVTARSEGKTHHPRGGLGLGF